MSEHIPQGDFAPPETTPGARISYQAGPSTVYDPADARYWDVSVLKEEV